MNSVVGFFPPIFATCKNSRFFNAIPIANERCNSKRIALKSEIYVRVDSTRFWASSTRAIDLFIAISTKSRANTLTSFAYTPCRLERINRSFCDRVIDRTFVVSVQNKNHTQIPRSSWIRTILNIVTKLILFCLSIVCSISSDEIRDMFFLYVY